MKENIGQVVVAEIIGFAPNPYYKIKAKVKTGNLKGEEIYVAHRGNPNNLKGDIAIRLDKLKKIYNELNDINICGYFVTSTIPVNFDYYSANNIILYGRWLPKWKEVDWIKGKIVHQVPVIGKIGEHYDIGIMVLNLHYMNYNGKPLPFTLYSHNKPELELDIDKKPKSPSLALKRYLQRLDKNLTIEVPRVVTFDEGLEDRIFSLFERTDLRCIPMEPQK